MATSFYPNEGINVFFRSKKPDRFWTESPAHRYPRGMGIIATIMNTATGQPLQKMSFGRMPKPWASFTLETGELVTAERIDVGKPAPGKFAAPVSIWVTVKPKD